jgi:thiopeptide-type bacteriocin biosynthesis protein
VELKDEPGLDSLFFARYNTPDWQVRFRVLGRPDWVDGPVRERIDRSLRVLEERGLFSSCEFASYQREYERYGGPEGMRLAERIFLHDSVACLEVIRAEAAGATAKSRREHSLLMTEKLLDLMGLEGDTRLRFYEFGYSWTTEVGGWEPEEFAVLDRRYEGLRDGLRQLLGPEADGDPELLWGGPEPARIARTCLERTGPVIAELLDAHAAGKVAQPLWHLAWSYCHMSCNRLGVEAPAEAILRYFMRRFHGERRAGAA